MILTGKIEEKNKIKPEDIVPVNELETKFAESGKIQYVTNYGIDIDGDGDATDDWQIFYIEDYEGEDGVVDENNQPTRGKRIFLIASDYVKADTKELQEAVKSDEKTPIMESGEGKYADYIKYWSSAPDYHCTLPDNEIRAKACTFPKLFEFSNYDIKDNAAGSNEYINSKCASSLLCTENWGSFKDGTYAEYATGGPSVEMWINSWNKRHTDKPLSYSGKGKKPYGYYVGSGSDATTYGASVNNTDPLYFPHSSKYGDFDNDSIEESCNRVLVGISRW